jgi:hypothetical protein
MGVQPLSPIILCAHPDTPGRAVSGIKAFTYFASGDLVITYVITGEIDRLRVPHRKIPRQSRNLWQHSCCEAFIAMGRSPGYYELNFSPSGEWAAYEFRAYRDGHPLENEKLEPGVSLRRQQNVLELTASVRLDHLAGVPKDGSFRLGLAAVIEENDGALSYWALRHPRRKPDFHAQDNFLLHFSR